MQTGCLLSCWPSYASLGYRILARWQRSVLANACLGFALQTLGCVLALYWQMLLTEHLLQSCVCMTWAEPWVAAFWMLAWHLVLLASVTVPMRVMFAVHYVCHSCYC